tara:strand:+ start:142 stop:1425 length:1284 start_codon:yes stop_codon:yes gene_type:complete
METVQLHEIFITQKTISTDSRKKTAGAIYFALSGSKFNGNDFAQEALNNGASYAVVDNIKLKGKPNHLYVKNALDSLQALGTYHRNYCKATVISLTGSNGKTTTKELIYSVLASNYNTVATQGNLNNHIGVPLSLLSIKEDTEFAVIEMGANHQGEIKFLSELSQPDIGCIINYGKAHLEGFGGVEGVIKGKSELYDFLKAHEKTILFNYNDPIQLEKNKGYKNTVSFGYNTPAEFITSAIIDSDSLSFNFQGVEIKTQLYGNYNATNCMIAASIGAYYKVPLPQIKKAIESYQPNNNRSELKKIGPHQLILDAYNANPSSMSAAIAHFSRLKKDPALEKIVILGDMFEIGDTAVLEHQAIVQQLEESFIDQVVLVGAIFSKTIHNFSCYSSYESFEKEFQTVKLNPSLILLKGSRGMALERILAFL